MTWPPSGRAEPKRRSDAIRVLLAALAAVLLAASAAQARLGPEQYTRATFYSTPPCDNQGTTTASGQHVHFGVIASDWLPLYTRIRLDKPLHGRRDFQVVDTGARFDVWLPCGPWTVGWANPTLGFRILK